MNLYDKWTNMVTEFVKTKGEAVFWNEYKNVELKIYKDILLVLVNYLRNMV